MSGSMLAPSAFLSCWYTSEWQSFVLKRSPWDLTLCGHAIDLLRMPIFPGCISVQMFPHCCLGMDGTSNKDAREGQDSGERDSVQDRHD